MKTNNAIIKINNKPKHGDYLLYSAISYPKIFKMLLDYADKNRIILELNECHIVDSIYRHECHPFKKNPKTKKY